MDFLLKQKEIFEKLIGKNLVTKSNTDIPDTILSQGDGMEMETEIETERDALSVTCNGKKYYYCLGEILTKEFDPTFLNAFMHDATEADAYASTTNAKVKPPVTYRIHFCIYQINVKAVVPFLEFWMTQTGYGGVDTNGQKIWEFPQFEVTLSEEAMKDHALVSDELLTAISENGKKLGIYSETMILNSENILKTMDGFIEYDTKPMEDDITDDDKSEDMDKEKDDEGGVESDAESGDEDNVKKDMVKGGVWFLGNTANPLAEKQEMFVFLPFTGLGEMKTENGIWAILDEIMNHQKIVDVPVSAFDSEIFYQNPDLMTLYGSDINPLDEERKTVYTWMEWNDKKLKSQCSISKVPQEIPYCLYLCEDKKEEELEEELVSETELSESEEELESESKGRNEDNLEKKPVVLDEKSPKEKYNLSEKEYVTTPPRVEDDYGYYWYFTNENISGQKNAKRYAVFMYNTYYDLEKKSKEILVKLGEADTEIHDSIYFQRDGIPFWCVKHLECFAKIDEVGKLISNETKST